MTYDHEDTWLRLHPEDLAAYISQHAASKAQLAACEQAATKADERWAEEVSIAKTTLESVRRAVQEAIGCDHAWLHSDEFIAKQVKTLWHMAGEPLDADVAERHAFRAATERLRNDIAEQFAVNLPKGAVLVPGVTVEIVGAGDGFPGYAQFSAPMDVAAVADQRAANDQYARMTPAGPMHDLCDPAPAGHQSLSGALSDDTAGQSLGPAYDAHWEDDADQGPAVIGPEATGQMTPVDPPAEWCGENTGPDGAVCGEVVVNGVCIVHGEVGPERAVQGTKEVTW